MIYRNGIEYGTNGSLTENQVSYYANSSRFVFCQRHCYSTWDGFNISYAAFYNYGINLTYAQVLYQRFVDATTPTANPTHDPSIYPSTSPSNNPSSNPSNNPSSNPSSDPSSLPSSNPSNSPSNSPSSEPSNNPSSSPSNTPSNNPSSEPSNNPSSSPSNAPSTDPSSVPSSYPTNNPTQQPNIGDDARTDMIATWNQVGVYALLGVLDFALILSIYAIRFWCNSDKSADNMNVSYLWRWMFGCLDMWTDLSFCAILFFDKYSQLSALSAVSLFLSYIMSCVMCIRWTMKWNRWQQDHPSRLKNWYQNMNLF